MIIENFLQAKGYLPAIAIKTDITSIDDMFCIAETELADDILGQELHSLLNSKRPEDSGLFKQCQRIVAINGFIKAVPDLDLVLTQSGFAVHNSEAMAPASSARVNAMVRSLQERLDFATDNLIKYLLASGQYEDIWRTSPQFDRITSGLICNYSEFKQFAQYSNSNASQYPKSYSEFKRMYTNLNLALMGEVSSYISRDYCNELIEKYRDNEIFSLDEKYVLCLIRYAICAISMGDTSSGINHITKARAYMKRHPKSFPTFISSSEAQTLFHSDNDGAIFSML